MDRADDKRAPLNFLTFPILPTFSFNNSNNAFSNALKSPTNPSPSLDKSTKSTRENEKLEREKREESIDR